MEWVMGAIGLGVTVLLFLVGIIIKQGRDHRAESNKRLDETSARVDTCNAQLGQQAVSIARIETSVSHLSTNVDGLTRWKDELQERTIQRLRDEAAETPAIAAAVRGRRRAAGGETEV